MKKQIISCLLIFFFLISAAENVIPVLDSAPVIDGKPGEKAWKNALSTKSFSKSSPESIAWIGQYNGILYFAVKAKHNDLKNHVNNRYEHDGPVYQDDDIELFVDFRGRKLDYLHIIGNACGCIMDSYVNEQKQTDLRYDSGAKVRGSTDSEYVYFEMAVPLAVLRLNENETGKVGFGFMRFIRYNSDAQGAFGAQFHKPETWPQFLNPVSPLLLLKNVKGKLVSGRPDFEFTIQNKAHEKMEYQAAFCSTRRKFILCPQEEIKLHLPGKFQAGQYAAPYLSVTNKNGRELMRWSTRGTVQSVLEIKVKSKYVYQIEALNMQFALYEPNGETLEVIVIDSNGNVFREQKFAPKKSPYFSSIQVNNGKNIIRCKYKGETKEFLITSIPSPWMDTKITKKRSMK